MSNTRNKWHCECREDYRPDEDGTYPAIAACVNSSACASAIRQENYSVLLDTLALLRGHVDEEGVELINGALSHAHKDNL